MPKMHGHHELPTEADCDVCGQPVNPVTRHNFHPQTGTVTCNTCQTSSVYYKYRREEWE